MTRDFYASIGWNIDFDQSPSDEIRFVQITPPGSACSIAFGRGLVEAEPGSLRGVQLVVRDADAALAMLRGKGVDAEDVQELAWGRFVTFRDPDGNTFTLQELPEWSQGFANRPEN
ncbi:glyoxalase [Pseudolysinimonas sp.]|uniref:glyoxalase n=1 Tax=Pseudolysinimonas sp. TaxID=2680009 RepID=UPI003F81DC73